MHWPLSLTKVTDLFYANNADMYIEINTFWFRYLLANFFVFDGGIYESCRQKEHIVATEMLRWDWLRDRQTSDMWGGNG